MTMTILKIFWRLIALPVLLGCSLASAQGTTNQWLPAAPLMSGRFGHSATLMPSGKVLVVGGTTTLNNVLASAELYDPATDSWSAAGTLAAGRWGHTATLLPSGKVLVVGGAANQNMASAELYDPATNAWSSAGASTDVRIFHSATLLSSGKVLVAGGCCNGIPGSDNSYNTSVDLYDPATNSWSAAAALATPRSDHTATLLPSGKVLVAGGYSFNNITSSDIVNASAELYDPGTNSWSATGSLSNARYQQTANLLPSGKVLVVGGADVVLAGVTGAELYDPATGAWTAAGAATARVFHTAMLLPSGKVMLIGGFARDNGNLLGYSDVYDPVTNSWGVDSSGIYALARYRHTATSLPNGEIFMVGGLTSLTVMSSTAIYGPAAPANGFVALKPTRLLDTRVGNITADDFFEGIGAMQARSTVDLAAAGRCGVPASGVVAVVLNVTVTNPTAAGYITAWPSGMSQPLTSNLNFVAGQTIANLMIAKLGTNGSVSLYNSAGTADLVADVVGYFDSSADLNTLTPARFLDTRTGASTIDGQFQGIGSLSAGGVLNLTIGGRDGIPSSGVGAAILNVTAVQPTAPGYLALWPSDAAQPWVSNLNFMPGDVIPNLVISKMSANGQVSIYNSAGNSDVVADVAGWFPVSSQLTPVVPARLMDTRAGAQTIDNQFAGNGALASNGIVNLTVLNRGSVPASGVSAVVLNVTATGPTAPGYLTVWPSGASRPLASNLNFVTGKTIPNLVIAKLGTNGQVALYNGSIGTSQVVVDVVGWFAGP